ncbi:hypothetical protein EUGRSUZ_B01319 [Eucalyptus grandis]|uniref:Uncharacterized protein n=2 Tax=Eucalyptus grandis TaxID=71139 RepID=A0ACC3LQF1_EUCGR|nr:hypothetical protein EUGRSUZ_B01319 [Eucalyptus grandis]
MACPCYRSPCHLIVKLVRSETVLSQVWSMFRGFVLRWLEIIRLSYLADFTLATDSISFLSNNHSSGENSIDLLVSRHWVIVEEHAFLFLFTTSWNISYYSFGTSFWPRLSLFKTGLADSIGLIGYGSDRRLRSAPQDGS